MAASPTPPQPNTATDCLPPHAAGVDRRTDAGHHAAAEQAGRRRRRLGSTFVHWPAATSVLSDEGADAERRRQHGAVLSVIFCVALWVAKQYQARREAGPAAAAHGPPVEDHVVAGATSVTPWPTASTTPAASWPRRNGKSSLIPPSR